MKQRGVREKRRGMESELGGGDWRPFLFFGRMSFSGESGNAGTETLQVFVEAGWWKLSRNEGA
jgi:hypothetical protein